jgi:hypothetical protein
MFFTVNSFAQNARFSQIGTAAIQFNPSLTGRFDGKVRLSALSSWQETNAASMEHQNISLDAKFGKYKSSGDDESTTTAVESVPVSVVSTFLLQDVTNRAAINANAKNTFFILFGLMLFNFKVIQSETHLFQIILFSFCQ